MEPTVPSVCVKTATTNDGSTVNFDDAEFVLIVGPNNSGKSQWLRDVYRKIQSPQAVGIVVSGVTLAAVGTSDDLKTWIGATGQGGVGGNADQFSKNGNMFSAADIVTQWQHLAVHGLQSLLGLFTGFLSAEGRIGASNPSRNAAFHRESPANPIQTMFRSRAIEERIRAVFFNAFGEDLMVHPHPGLEIPLYVGNRPALDSGEPITSDRFVSGVESQRLLQHEGDGMRSFAGIILTVIAGDSSILMIDEPEAYLHPPQANLLGRVIAKEGPVNRQVFVVTHSGDFLRGVLNAAAERTRVLRITRTSNTNSVAELSSAGLMQVWNDPLLRHANILDGLFHERVVVCEADGDCLFYDAMATALSESRGERRRDQLFVHCGGKARVPTAVKALRALKVPVCAIVDFDILNDESTLSKLVTELGGDWSQMKPAWKPVQAEVNNHKAELKAGEVKAKIDELITSVSGAFMPRSTCREIEEVVKRASTWWLAKQHGINHVPAGNARQMCNALLLDLANLGIHVVPVGELERFDPSVAGHGPDWVCEVVRKNLATAPELHAAREFVSGWR